VLQTSRRYFSRYFGKSVANEDSSVNAPALLSVGRKVSIFHYVKLEWQVREPDEPHARLEKLVIIKLGGQTVRTYWSISSVSQADNIL